MKETVISWTFANWVTVCLMFFLGSIALGAIAAVISKAKKAQSDA